ncbi:MAG: dimethyl sulfoxide reductase anchor subunit family protein [Steroidobacteraceae bacterium]
MRPAASILLLTTLTGFGYGLLAWLGAYTALGLLPGSRGALLSAAGTALSLLLASIGLAASTLHLGRKAPAWRALTQWRSSWLSREAVAAALAYPVALAFGFTAWRHGQAVVSRLLGALALVWSLGTVYCTAMIYASLKPIRQWHNAHTALDYILYAIFSGAILFATLRAIVFGVPGTVASLSAAAAAAVALLAKCAYWRHIDRQTPLATLAAAIGLPKHIEARPLDAPHFTENYVLREMGFAIARRHASRLRSLALGIGFALPLALSVLAGMGRVSVSITALALLCTALGLLMERWLFFAQATHVAALFYGKKA